MMLNTACSQCEQATILTTGCLTLLSTKLSTINIRPVKVRVKLISSRPGSCKVECGRCPLQPHFSGGCRAAKLHDNRQSEHAWGAKPPRTLPSGCIMSPALQLSSHALGRWAGAYSTSAV